MADRYWVGNGTDTAWTSTGNWSTTSGGSGGSSVPGLSDSVYFDGNGVGDCILSGDIDVASFDMHCDVYTGTFTDNGYTLTVYGNFRIHTDSASIDRLVATGTYKIAADGAFCITREGCIVPHAIIGENVTVNNTGYTSNYQHWIMARKITVMAGATVSSAGLVIWGNTANDPFDIDSTAVVNSNCEIRFYSWSTTYTQQKSISVLCSISFNYQTGRTLYMTGDWSCDILVIHGSTSAISEETAAVIDCNGYNLNCNYVRLGNSNPSYPGKYQGKIIFGSGTHNITYDIYVEGQYTYGYFDFKDTTIYIGDDFDLEYSTVNNYNGKIIFNGTGDQSVWCSSNVAPALYINKSGGSVILQDDLYCKDLNIIRGTFNTNGNNVYMQQNILPLKLSGFDRVLIGKRWVNG
jgi:hypothetical protein